MSADGDGTRVVRAGLPAPVAGEPFLPGPSPAAPFHLPGDPLAAPFTYGRYDNPSWRLLEAALGELEGGEALVFASGMAAISAVLQSLLRPGDTLVMPSDGYYTARQLAEEDLAPTGIRVVTVPTASPDLAAAVAGATLVWLESPSNPGLDVCDLAAVCAAARRAGAVVAVNNAAATPLGQLPLALGAHLSVASDTKALTGSRRPRARPRRHRRPRAAGAPAPLAHPHRRGRRPVRGLAGPPLAGDARRCG